MTKQVSMPRKSLNVLPRGKALHDRRVALGITLRDLSAVIGYDWAAIAKFERGEIHLDRRIIQRYNFYIKSCEAGDIPFPKSDLAGKTIQEINHLKHYSPNGVEALDFIDAFGLNFTLGNVVKYISRAGHKDGEDSLTALLKARFYLNHEIERLQKGGSHDSCRTEH